jgi:hypothetical protein
MPWSGRPHCSRGDGSKQVVPVLEDHIGGDGPRMLEEAVGRTKRDDGGSPGKNDEISGGVEGEGQQVEGEEDIGEGFLAVPEAVFKVVAAGLGDVASLVLYLLQHTVHRRPIRRQCRLRPRGL